MPALLMVGRVTRFMYRAGNAALGLLMFWTGVVGAILFVLGFFSQVPGTGEVSGQLLSAIGDLVLDLAEPLAEELIERACGRIEDLNCMEVVK